MHRFYIRPALPPSGEVELSSEQAHQIARVLRLAAGDRLLLFDGSGREAEVTLVDVTSRRATARIVSDLPLLDPLPALHLYQALIRPNRMEWLLEKATELGAASITLVITGRTQIRMQEVGDERFKRWNRLMVEAAEQCGRRTLPPLLGPVPLEEALETAPRPLLMPWEGAAGLGDSIGAALAEESSVVSLLVGPEGGFSEDEIHRAIDGGARTVSLGPSILRSETAAIAALALAAGRIAKNTGGR